MEQAIIGINLETENDVYFGIANTILSYTKKECFTERDIVKELTYSFNWGKEVFKKWNIKKMIKISIQNLIEHGKVGENPRSYYLRS